MSTLKNYDPFTYQPMMRSFYMGRQFPQSIEALRMQHPDKANHIGAVYNFSNWMQQELPDLYSQIRASAPNVLDAGSVVLGGSMGARVKNRSGVSGMSGMGDILEYGTDGQSTGSSGTNNGSGDVSLSAQVTEWGKIIADFGKSFLTYDSQKKLLDANIKRAEQGLAPLDSSAYGLGVNVGLSPQTQNLVIMALVGFGLFAAVKSMRK